MLATHFYHELSGFLASESQVDSLCVAYSGGLDSSVLLQLAAGFCKQYSQEHSKKITLRALHVNHGLSQKADGWQVHCENICKELECDLGLRSVNIDLDNNVEKQAREKRYQFFQEQCGENDVLLMGHHLNDQAETLLFRFFRGNSAKALKGIPKQRNLFHQRGEESKNVQVLRPLLNFSKQELRDYAEHARLTWVEDESNRDEKYARNFIRHNLLPSIRKFWPKVDENLSRSARYFSEAENLLQDLAELDLQALLSRDKSLLRWGESICLLKFHHLSLARQKNVLRYWMAINGVDAPPENRLLSLIVFAENLARESSGEVSWKQDESAVLFRAFENHLFFHCEALSLPSTQTKQWRPSEEGSVTFGAYRYSLELAKQNHEAKLDLAHVILELRCREGGERCQPLGRAHSQSLKKLFQEYRIPSWEREQAPVFYLDGEIVALADFWVCKGFLGCESEENSPRIERMKI